jgi:hypothetical protein
MEAVSQHAQTRLQQRSIPPAVLDLLNEFGAVTRSHGAERIFFDKAARKRLEAFVGGKKGLRPYERYLNVYVVVADDGLLITAGHRTRRFKRH